MITFVHQTNTHNTGDQVSGPYNWFTFPHYAVADMAERFADCDVAVYGGGAMTSWLQSAPRRSAKRIAWGVGSTRHGETEPHPMPDGYDLFGMREYVDPKHYVPCPSCMSGLFDRQYTIRHEAVLFANASDNIRLRYPFAVIGLPRFDNTASLERILDFLGSAETVVTNSFHGAYWATLLGRRVVCVPYSSKFHHMKFPPAMSRDGADWRTLETRTYPEALEDCRAVNRAFYNRVMEAIGCT